MDRALNTAPAPAPTVAIARGRDRRAAVAAALGLIAEDLRGCVRPEVLIKPNLVSHRRQLPSTHADTLAATLDALADAGARRFTIAEGASDATAGYERFGYRRLVAQGTHDVRFLDLNRAETAWDRLDLQGTDGTLRPARIARTLTASACRVSLAIPKTHVTAMVTLSLKNMLSSVHPADRVLMHGAAGGGGNGYQGWRRLAVEFLKGDSTLVNVLTRTMGRLKRARQAARERGGRGLTFAALSPADLNYLRTVEAMNRNLVRLTRAVGPHLAVVDGWVGMHREGPRHGTPIRFGTVIAGTDPVAVDAVATAMMGFEPLAIGYLAYADAAGLGVADLAGIRLVGEPLARVRRGCVPHSNDAIQRHWSRLGPTTGPGPHAPRMRRPVRPSEVTR